MALKPTIYKFNIALSDLNRNHYETLNLTVAQHPSETLERMMSRVLAYNINAQEFLSFTKGLSAIEEPDLWVRTLDDQIALWIDIGEPAVDRIKKASRQAMDVRVYSFNTKADVWWEQSRAKFAALPVSVYQFDRPGITALAALVKRTMDASITITGDSAYFATDNGDCEISWNSLQQK